MVQNQVIFMIFCSFVTLVLRDVNERGRDLDQILYQYTTFVKPAFEEFCLPVSHSVQYFDWLYYVRGHVFKNITIGKIVRLPT